MLVILRDLSYPYQESPNCLQRERLVDVIPRKGGL